MIVQRPIHREGRKRTRIDGRLEVNITREK